jgi:hypothetical protein
VQRGERRLGGARERRRLAARVVADERERPALGVRAGEVRVTERVHRTVEPRVLAVPDPHDAVVLRRGQVLHELRAVDGGRGELLVEAGGELDRVLGAEPAEPHHFLVEAAERRALVAGDEGRGVEAGADVGAVLVEQHAHERLDAAEEDRALLEDVLVLQRGLGAAELDGTRVRARCDGRAGRPCRFGRRRHEVPPPLGQAT